MVRSGSIDLATTERGNRQGPTVVFIHGFPDTGAVWDPTADVLATDCHVVTYDVRGAGSSTAPAARAEYALPLLVDDVEAIINATSPDRPVHLVAHDWGSIQGWEAVTTERLAGRFASYTSISGPPIDHVGLWARRHRTRHPSDLWAGLRQAMHSWYIAYFQLPYLPERLARTPFVQRMFAKTLHRLEGVPAGAGWPAPTLGEDFAQGVNLYRANIRPRLRHPHLGHATCPVQLIVPLKDHYVTPNLLDGLEEWTTVMWRRPVQAGHWVIRTHPAEVGGWIREVIAFVAGGTESVELQRGRVA
jgi:pimeloyl-ACP methyl ester carboxylesterase